MPKQLNVDLRFNADTSSAKRQIQDLQQSLSKLGMDSIKSLNFDKMNSELLEANQNVNKLKAQLTSAFNTNTGKLDLTKFTQEMERSGMSLEKYQKSLMALGPEGSKAFAELANSIAAADVPLLRTNKLLTEMGTVLKNTIKWQISSSAIHGFMGAIQQAYGYAQDLNESLTNIRIVTGQTSEQMAQFAERANRAAQALSTTTTAYSDAALIFYQQGLNDQQVEERTNATIKMAQATGDSATEVSSYMTAIWNNFNDGSQSLEHYADVITALGAATASSSSEISEGLSKFASIADTVGLSYEYATSALATVVAQTRLSADVVGTAFKTIFARIQDLEQGATLEDGVDLGQYAKSLAKVGVDVLDANGKLREMDSILDDIGQRWGELDEAQRVALAQNVAGQRQYAQFMAIFENWDTFQENLSVANTSDGTLQKQADTYAESWEASQKRVKAAMEGIYQSIIDDDFFIKVNDFLSNNINGVNNLIKAMGGLPGLLSTIGALVTRFLGPQMANGLRDMATNIMMLTNAGREKVKGQQLEALTRAQSGFADDSVESQIYREKLQYQQVYLENVEKINELDKLALGYEQQQLEKLGQETVELEKQAQLASEQVSKQRLDLSTFAKKNGIDTTELRKRTDVFSKQATALAENGVSFDQGYQIKELFEELEGAQSGKGAILTIKTELKDLAMQFGLTTEQQEKFQTAINRKVPAAQSYEEFKQLFEELGIDIEKNSTLVEKYESSYNNLIDLFEEGGVSHEEAVEKIQEFGLATENASEKSQQLKDNQDKLSTGYDDLAKKAKESGKGQQDWAQSIVNGAQVMSTLAMTLTSLKGMFQTLTDENMSFGDKLLSVMTTIGMLIPMVASLSKTIDVLSIAEALNIQLTGEATLANLIAAGGLKKVIKAIMQKTAATIADTAAMIAHNWKILVLIAAVALLVKAFEMATDAYNKDAIAAQKAKEAATNLAEAYNEVRDACEQFKRTASDYQSARDALDDLTKGTQEYTDALFKANEAAMQLIESGKIASNQYSWENGAIVIEDSVLEEAQRAAQQDVFNLQAASQMANVQALQAQNQADLVAIRRSNDGLISNDVQNAIIATLVGNVAGALTYGFGGQVAGNAAYDALMQKGEWSEEAEIERIAELYQSIGEGAFVGSELFQNATDEMQESIREYCQQVQQAETQTKAYAEQIAHANLNVEEFGEAAIEFASSQYVEDYNQAYQDALEDTRDHINQASNENDQEARRLWRRYQQATGVTAELEGVEGTDSNRSFTYLDEEGNLQHVYAEQMASAIAASEAINGLGESAKAAADFLSGLSDENERAIFEDMFSHISNGRIDTASFLGNYMTTGGISNIDTTGLMNYWISGIQDENNAANLTAILDEIGMSYQDLVDFANQSNLALGDVERDIVEGWIASVDAMSNYIDGLSSEARELYDSTAIHQLNDVAAREMLDFFNNAMRNGMGDVANEMMSSMSIEEMQNFVAGLRQVDWNSINGSEFLEIMAENGVEVDNYQDALIQLCNTMRVVTSETIAASAEYYNKLQKIADGITDQSDEISAEDYQSLPAYMQEYFTLTIDGTYKLLGAARDFRDMVEDARIADARDNRASLAKTYNDLMALNPESAQALANQVGGSYGERLDSNNGYIYSRSNGQIENGISQIEYVVSGSGFESRAFSSQTDAQAYLREQRYYSANPNGTYDPNVSYDGAFEANTEVIQQQIDMIHQLTSDYDAELNRIGNDFTEQNTARVQEILQTVIETEGVFDDLEQRQQDAHDALVAQDLAIALHYDDLSELQQAYQEGTVATLEAYNAAAYQIDQAQDTAMLDEEEWQEYSDYIREAADELEGFNDNMTDAQADIVAKGIMKMNQAIETLSSNFDEWSNILTNSSNSSEEFADAMRQTQNAVAMLLDVSEDFVSSTFISEHLDLIGQAAEGDAESIDELRTALSEDIIANIIVRNELDDKKPEIMEAYQSLMDSIPVIEVGMDVDDTSFIEALNELIDMTGMTVDQVNALCDSMGFEAAYDTEEVPYTQQIPITTTHHNRYIKQRDKDGNPIEWVDREESYTEYKPATGKYNAFAVDVASGGDRPVARITGLTKKAGGAQNNFSSSNSGGGRTSGGGGGSDSGSQKAPKDPAGEIERYHVINNQIEDNEKALDRLSKAKDRAYGKAKLNAMDAEIAKQRESVELAERKLQEVEKYLELDSGAIAAFGAEFDANGTIVNYDQLMQEQINKYNAAVEAYNNGPMDENADAIFQQAEDDYNAFTEALQQYEETQDLWYEQAQAVADAKAEVLQLELEKTNYKVEIGIEWEEEDIARLDFMLKRIEDDAHKAAEAIGLLGERTVDAMDKYNVYQQGFADTLRNLGVGNAEDVIARASAGEDLYGMIGNIVDPNEMAQAVDQMDDYISNMMSSLEDAQDSVDQAFEKVKDLFNENIKQMDTYIEKIEFCQKITKSYMNIVDIVGKKSLGITNEVLRTFNAESVTQAVNNEAAAKAKMDSIQAQLMESQARLAQASGEAEQKYWNEIIEEQEKELISATENFHQAWEDALQANLEAFENNIELVVEDFSDAVGDLNAMKAEWDLQKSLTDMWEPEYERWHQLSDLINDINKSVDENENLKYKQDLLDLETEIEQLQEQEAKLSEYDLNYLRLRYESKLAEIALEEAEAAKSQVRMSRDNEGNYSYVYTADEDAVNNAADDYRNKIYEMEKANEEYIDTLQGQLMDMHDEMLESLKQAAELYGKDTDEYAQAALRIYDTYRQQSEFIEQQLQNTFDNNQRLRDEDIVQYVAYTGDIAAQNVDLQYNFGDTYMGIQTQTDDLQTYFNDTWLPALEETFNNVIQVSNNYAEANEVAMETAGTTMDGFRDRASQNILEVTEKTTELAEETQNYGETAVDQFAQAARAWQTGPGALLDSINTQAQAIANLAQQYTSLKSQLDAAAQAARDFAAAMGQRASVSSSVPSISPTSGGFGGGSGSSYNFGGGPGTNDTLDNSSRNNAGIYQAINQLENGPHNMNTRNQLISLYNQIGRPMSQWPDWVTGRIAFDTGGYTGEWGDDGRIAVLHQKELVLNAKDTSNILTAVDVVRQLASSIDSNTMTAGLATASIKSASGNSGTLEQRVEITANFPNATDRNEIEQAFQNIVNMASQYAQRKND